MCEEKEVGEDKCRSSADRNWEGIIGDKEMAEQLNAYFGSVFTNEDTNQMPGMLENARFSEREELREINISR